MEKNQYPKPDYGGFKHPIFQKMRRYIRFAKEHMALCDLESDCIHWEVKSSATTLNIPTKYHIHYFFKSIVSIDEGQNPVYGNHHILELTLPKNYPIEPCRIYLISDIWHPNIKSEGKEKGRVCANAMNLGKAFTLDLLVIRIGEILQYKNYHAKHVPPFPEDSKVAKWVTTFAEPNDIVNKEKGIVVDDTPLVGHSQQEAIQSDLPTQVEVSKEPPVKEQQEETATTFTTNADTAVKEKPVSPAGKIRIGMLRKNEKKGQSKIKLNVRKDD